MNKKSLAALALVGTCSVYLISHAQNPPSGTAPTDSTSLGNLDLNVNRKSLQSVVATPTSTQWTRINNGTFNDNAADQCPATPACPPPGDSTVLSTCPDVCWVGLNQASTTTPGGVDLWGNPLPPVTTTNTPPTGMPYTIYPTCPTGYTALASTDTEIDYQYYPETTFEPTSTQEKNNYISEGYSCSLPAQSVTYGRNWSTENWTMAGPNGSNPGWIDFCNAYGSSFQNWQYNQEYQYNGKLYYVHNRQCEVVERGGCWATVSCGVAHNLRIRASSYVCTRQPGTYPNITRFATGGAPQFKHTSAGVICARVKQVWNNN